MKRLVLAGVLGLVLLGARPAVAQNCCACAGIGCSQTGCINVASIKQCIDFCAKQGATCKGSRYLQNSDCAMSCRKRTRVHSFNTTGGK